MFGKSKHKCVYCGDKHKQTKKHFVKVYTNSNDYDKYIKVCVCRTCGRLRGLL